MKAIAIDFETYSPYDIRTRGLDVYMQGVEPLIMAWADPLFPKINCYDVLNNCPSGIPGETWELMASSINSYIDQGYRFIAHNYKFEKLVMEWLIGKEIPLDRFICTEALCALNGLPLGLDNACKFLEIEGKDPEGSTLMRRFSSPRKPTKNNPDTRHWPEKDPVRFNRYVGYGHTDVRIEIKLFQELQRRQGHKS